MDPLIARLPVPADTISCGNRLDWPKKQRRHAWQDAGIDVRNKFDKGYVEVQVWICFRCGKDKDKTVV